MARELRVLVVDDSALMRKTIRRILTEAGGFDVTTARDGRDALDLVDRVKPAVVTLDVHMPEMDGLSCLAEIIRRHPCPVVMVSSLTERGAIATLEALALGAVDFVAKPGGTISLNLDDVATELVAKVRRAARARVRPGATDGARQPQSSTALPGAPAAIDAVLIGASTGGPSALTLLVTNLPADLAAPVIIAQHMPAAFTAPLARRLDEASAVRVREVTGQVPLAPGTVYLGRGDADIVIHRVGTGLVARSVPPSERYRWHPSTDRLVATARQAVPPERLIAVLMTGMGDDGADQVAALYGDGGRTIAESEESAVVWGMPGALVRRGGASVVLPRERIAEQVAAWARAGAVSAPAERSTG